MGAKFVVNGKEYERIEDMPPEVRSMYQSLGGLLADTDHNGLPDIMEGKGGRLSVGAQNVPVNIVHDGKVYSSITDLPPDLREKYDNAMQAFGSMNVAGVASAGALPALIANMYSTAVTSHILHEGKILTDPSQLPPEASERYEKALKVLADTNKNGIPDILEGAAAMQVAGMSSTPFGSLTGALPAAPSGSPAGNAPAAQSSSPLTPSSSVWSTGHAPAPSVEGGGRTLMIAALVMLLLAAVVVIVALSLVAQNR